MTKLADMPNRNAPLTDADRKVLLDSARFLSAQAYDLRESNVTHSGRWAPNTYYERRDFVAMERLAAKLRRIAGCGQKRKGSKP